MTGTVPTPLAPLVQKFFTERLISQLGASANTIASYRDTFRLLLEFAEARCGLASTDMDISDIDADLVGNFLEHLETERGNRAQSRNVRLAAIRPFIRYVAVNEPQVLHHCQKILQLPAKRHKRGTVNWLTEDEVEALAAAPDLSTWYGRRDRALLVLAAHRPAFGCRNWSASGSGTSNSDAVPMCGAMARGARTVRHPCGAIR